MKKYRLKSFTLIDLIIAILLSGILVSSSYLMFQLANRMQIGKSDLSGRNFELLNLDILVEQNFFYSDSIYIYTDSIVFYREESVSALKILSDKIFIYRNNRVDMMRYKTTFNSFLNEIPKTEGRINSLSLKISDSTGKHKLYEGIFLN